MSARSEPGCQRFDVLEPVGQPDRIVLYEIYDDRAAFDAHCRSAHFGAFNTASAAYVRDKKVFEHDLVFAGSQPA